MSYRAYCPEQGCDRSFTGPTEKRAKSAVNGHIKVHNLQPELRVMARAAEVRLANEAAKARGKMYLLDPVLDPKTPEQVIREMVLILDHAPQAFPGSRRN